MLPCVAQELRGGVALEGDDLRVGVEDGCKMPRRGRVRIYNPRLPGSQLKSTIIARMRASRDADRCSLNESGMWSARDWLRWLTPRVSAGANQGAGLALAGRLWLTPSFSRGLC